MNRLVITFITFLLSLNCIQIFAQTEEYYFRFKISNPSEIDFLTNQLSIDKIEGNYLYGYANDREWEWLQQSNYHIERLPHPGALYDHRMSASAQDLTDDWDTYPTYTAYLDMMTQYADSFAAICRLDTIGLSVQGRLLLAMKITDNPEIPENEPEFFYTSTMHGDETVGYVLTLRLIDYLLHQYGQATPEGQRVTRLVDNLEIRINPLANPDGTYHGGNHTVTGAWRYNANFVDLNRDFPDRINDPNNTTAGRQPETAAMMIFATEHNFNLSANFHGGAQVVNYPWDNGAPSGSYSASPDDAWFIDVSLVYASTNQDLLNGGFPNGITNGCQWYAIYGGRQDWIYWWHGGRETTIELYNTKNPPGSVLPQRWNRNKESFLAYMEQTLHGIRGIVSDAASGEPLPAQIDVMGYPEAPVFTDPAVGDFHRLLLPGSYDVIVSAGGYLPDTLFNITVADTGATRLDVALSKPGLVPAFVSIAANFAGVNGRAMEWFDQDNDGDLDIFLAGYDGAANYYAKLYRNAGNGLFADIDLQTGRLTAPTADLCDLDRDGYIDFILTGTDSSGKGSTRIYHNNSGAGFTRIPANLLAISPGAAVWGDYDNDGDEDILLSGIAPDSQPYTALFRNDSMITESGWQFTEIPAGFTNLYDSRAAWGDFDNDGDLDLVLCGTDGSASYTIIYRNDGEGVFSEINASLAGAANGSVSWGDYDNDGDPDILLTGRDENASPSGIAKIYRNDGPDGANWLFTDINAGLPGIGDGSAAWADFDSDGDLDILLGGSLSGGSAVNYFRNGGNDSFTEAAVNLPALDFPHFRPADFDNDGDLDVLLKGRESGSYQMKLYRNDLNTANQLPAPPTALTAAVNTNSATLTWQRADDQETPAPGLSYNIRLGILPGGIDVVSPLSDAPTGYRRTFAPGNVSQDTSWAIHGLPDGTYYWSVQAIDHNFAGSAFAPEGSFVINTSGIEGEDDRQPLAFALHQNFPNPFNPMTHIEFDVPKNLPVTLKIYDLYGREVATLVNEQLPTGHYEIPFEAKDLASGIYFYRIRIGEFESVKKMSLIR